ncbi:MAG: 3-deoxy-D-manno-octulosonic acid transferase [Gammaproteobacteria bacterium]|nr:3-deoxy-D-manno-octulosonic acid transferase [Gammaproteobacteria bacterium]
MQRAIYNLTFYLAIPFLLLRLLLRSIKAPAYRARWGERFACINVPANAGAEKGCIWVHAVSVGETIAAIPLIQQLQSVHPKRSVIVTTTTPTGSDRVQQLLGDSVFHVYAPYDLPGAVKRFLARVQPSIFIIMETELWPNAIHYCHKHGVKIMLTNARLSKKSATGYDRIKQISRQMLSKVDFITAQSQPDADRFVALGADPEKILVTGSLKFDVEFSAGLNSLSPALDSMRKTQRPVFVAASTREGEDKKILSVLRMCLEQIPNLLLVLVPRHPERFNSAARLCEENGFNVQRRSADVVVGDSTEVLLGDSMGELLCYYRLADIAFVGGSLVDTGCQNVLEPAALGIPVLVGPSQFNFEHICNQLEEAGGLITVADEAELARCVIDLLSNRVKIQEMGDTNRKLVEANRGALPATLEQANKLLSESTQ